MYEKAKMTTAQEWIKKVSCWVSVYVWGGGVQVCAWVSTFCLILMFLGSMAMTIHAY